MIPIKDTVARRFPPTVTWTLIIVNCLVFLLQISLHPSATKAFLFNFALIPSRYFGELSMVYPPHGLLDYLPFMTNMFLHGGWLHLIFNMWSLWVFAPAVEDRLGVVRFTVFYLLSGISASFAHAFFNPSSTIPALGASGAIAGVIGCYVRMFPLSRLIVLVPIVFIPFFFEMPAIIFALLWFVMQIIPGLVELILPPDSGGVAWWAHIGGFVAGWVLAPFVRRKSADYRCYFADEGCYGLMPNGRRYGRYQKWL